MSRLSKRDAAALERLAKAIEHKGSVTVASVCGALMYAREARSVPLLAKLADSIDYHGSVDTPAQAADLFAYMTRWVDNAQAVLRRSRDENERLRLTQSRMDDLNASNRAAQRTIDDFRHKLHALEERVAKVEQPEDKQARRKQ